MWRKVEGFEIMWSGDNFQDRRNLGTGTKVSNTQEVNDIVYCRSSFGRTNIETKDDPVTLHSSWIKRLMGGDSEDKLSSSLLHLIPLMPESDTSTSTGRCMSTCSGPKSSAVCFELINARMEKAHIKSLPDLHELQEGIPSVLCLSPA